MLQIKPRELNQKRAKLQNTLDKNMMNRLYYATQFLDRGIAVIPLRHRGKEPASELMGGTWERYKSQLPTQYDLRRWLFSEWQNYGVVMGWGNLAVIDFDDPRAYEIWQLWFSQIRGDDIYGGLPYLVKTARGAHVYIRLYGDYQNQRRAGVDLKVHGYVAGPGCVHPSGAVYTPQNTAYYFPRVFSLDTILPLDLFPLVSESAIERKATLPLAPIAVQKQDYDAFQAASGATESADLIKKVKSYVRIESFFPEAVGTSMDGRWLAAVCPFHDDQKPSFWIDARRQICGCHVCNMKPMDVINLYARMHTLNETQAVSQLAREIGIWG